MPLWQRLLITLAIMLLTSYLVGLLWHWLFNSDIPSYLSGAVGGLSAVPTWEFLRRIRPSTRAICEPNSTSPDCRGASPRPHQQSTGAAVSSARALMP
jgi:hypothetical protein